MDRNIELTRIFITDDKKVAEGRIEYFRIIEQNKFRKMATLLDGPARQNDIK